MKKIKKYTVKLNFGIEESMLKEMERVCKKYNISVSEFIRTSIEISINNSQK